MLASSAEARAVDRAELLVNDRVSCRRAGPCARRRRPQRRPPRARETLPFVQLPALPADARRDAKKPKHFVDDLRTGLQVRLDVDAVQLAEALERISIAKAVSWVGFAVLALFLLTLASNWSEIIDAMSGIDWVWVAPIVIVTLLGTVGGAMSLSGSVVRPIALGEATIVMFGQSFLNRFTPMNAGGMAMRIRYLQKGGTDGTVATAAIGLTSAASGVVQVVFFVFFIVVANADPTGGLAVKSSGLDLSIVTVFAVAVVIVGVVLALSPKLRNAVVGFVKSTIAKIRTDFGELARRPSKLSLLFGGQAVAKLSTIFAFVWSCRAFDVDLAFVELGALYMVANTVASAVPTPGGVGAIEAALVFMLTSAQIDDPTAWAVVVLFRLINYWFPTIPGYFALEDQRAPPVGLTRCRRDRLRFGRARSNSRHRCRHGIVERLADDVEGRRGAHIVRRRPRGTRGQRTSDARRDVRLCRGGGRPWTAGDHRRSRGSGPPSRDAGRQDDGARARGPRGLPSPLRAGLAVLDRADAGRDPRGDVRDR